MNTRISLFAFFLLFLSLTACRDKDTVVHGRVVDKVTGEGLDSVAVDWIEYENLHNPSNEYVKLHSQFSNLIGEFDFLSPDYSVKITGVNDRKFSERAYLSKNAGFPEIKKGKKNEIEINLVPLDGTLQLTFQNNNNLDTLYLAIFSPSALAETPISNGYFIRRAISINNTTSLEYPPLPVPSEENIIIYWSLLPWINSMQIEANSTKDTILVVRGGTSYLTITI